MNEQGNIVNFRSSRRGCDDCSLNRHCVASGLSAEEQATLGAVAKHPRPLHRGERLFRAGERLENLYIVSSGSVKLVNSTADGLEQIVRFHLPGDLIGLDGLHADRFTTTAVALETTSICVLPIGALENLMCRMPRLQRQVLRLVGKEINGENNRIVMLSQRSARERFAAFLLHLADQYGQRGFSHTEFNLSMSRQDIANYLALAIETVSRLFTAFETEGLIDVDRRLVRLRAADSLRGMADLESVPVAL
ncbi:MAG: cyclic nucleotide-binding domain-containing protein [Gammaproteobacteria bacterium]